MAKASEATGVQNKRTRKVEREYIHNVTGEVLSLTHEEVITPRRRPNDERTLEPFSLVFAPEELAQVRLPPLAWRCLWYLLAQAPLMQPTFQFSNVEMAKELGTFPQKTTLAIRQLLDAEMLTQRDPHARTVTLNPRYFWRGTPKERRSAL